MQIEEALSLAKAGEAVLFTGAGFSFGAKNIQRSPDDVIPDARAFARRLAKQVGDENEYDLPIISQYFMDIKGEHELLNQLTKNFTPFEVLEYHIKISSLPWRRVYTTNYDTVFEISAEKSGKSWKSIGVSELPNSDSNCCVHINGHINQLSIHNLLSQIKLTHSSYSADSFAQNAWSQQLRQDLMSAKAVIFIGYSLSDLDIARILHQNPDLIRKTVFVVGPNENPISTSQLSKFGKVECCGVARVSEILDAVSPPAVSDLKHVYTWLEEYLPEEPKKPSDKDSIDLLTLGMARSSFVNWSQSQPTSSYCFDRVVGRQIIEEVDKGRRWFLLHSDLGNGKTIVKFQVSARLHDRGYRVFWDTSFDLNRSSDLARLRKEESKIAIFIDETPDRFEIIDGLLTANHPHVIVFICVRSTLYELGEALYEKSLPHDYIPIDANKLNDAEIEEFSLILDKLGMWGKKARLLPQEKQNYLKVECDRSISKAIVSIFEDSEVGRRLCRTADNILNDRSDVASVIIASFLLNRIGHLPTPTLLSDVVDLDCWSLAKSPAFTGAGEFVRFSNGFIGPRSSIVSTFLLRRSLKAENLIWHIEKIVRHLAGIRRNKILNHVFIELQRFPVLENVLDSPNKRQMIIGYFEAIKDIPYNNRRALFWLHYAMARLSFGEFRESSYYFEQAKAFAKGSSKELSEVNNHYARLLLDSRTKGDDYSDYWDAFCAAHQILLDQMNRGGNKHFPFRQAKNYTTFISYRKQRLSAREVEQFISSCRQVLSAISNLSGSIKNSMEVQQCHEAMLRAIEIAEMKE